MSFFETEAGTHIYYEKHGSTGPIVVLLHGLASTSRIWLKQIRTLSRQCQVYVLDFPGHGQSSWQEHYTLNELTAYLKEWLDELDISHVNLVAISLGCSVALDFAARYPDRVNKLVLEGPIGGYHDYWHPLGWLDWMAFRMLPLILQASVRVLGHRATAHWINTFGVKAPRNFKVLETVQRQTDFKAIRDLLWDSAYVPYIGQLERITAPVILIRGQNDPMPMRFANYIRLHLQKVTFIEVPGTRHLVVLEKPSVFNKIVIDFLKPGTN